MQEQSEVTQTAIQAIKRGDTQRGIELLVRSLKMNPNDELAWLWLSAVVATTEERRYCLEMIREMNPDNFNAKVGLVKLGPGAARRPTELKTHDEIVKFVTVQGDQSRSSSRQGNEPIRIAWNDYIEVRDERSPHSVLLLTIILIFMITILILIMGAIQI